MMKSKTPRYKEFKKKQIAKDKIIMDRVSEHRFSIRKIDVSPHPRCKCGHRKNTHFRSKFKCNWAGLNPGEEFTDKTTVDDIKICACTEYRPQGQPPPKELL